jgi:hypothetical protein
VEFSEMLLPYLVHEILVSGGGDHRQVLSEMVSDFFQTHYKLTSSSSTAASAKGLRNTKIFFGLDASFADSQNGHIFSLQCTLATHVQFSSKLELDR